MYERILQLRIPKCAKVIDFVDEIAMIVVGKPIKEVTEAADVAGHSGP